MAYDVAKLLKLSQAELDTLFTNSAVGKIPDGEAEGTAIVAPGTIFSSNIASFVSHFAWQGKVFDAKNGCLKNRVTAFGIRAIKAELPGVLTSLGVSNVSFGFGTAAREVLNSVEKIAGIKLDVREEPRRAGDPPSLVARCDRVRELLKWQPRLDDIDTIVRTSLEWEKRLQREPW